MPQPPTITIYLGLGSNLGDRDAHLQAALTALAPSVTLTAVSAIYDTPPLLVTEQPRFHNAVCSGRTTLEPHTLLQRIKHIETNLGRIVGPRYGPRVIDIDMLLYGALILDTPTLTLPHPRLAERAFALLPLAELAPDLRHPLLGKTIAELVAALSPSDRADIRRAPQQLQLPDPPVAGSSRP